MPSNLSIDGHSFRRVEVLTEAPRRRRWSTAEKAAIVAESFTPGAVASMIALRHAWMACCPTCNARLKAPPLLPTKQRDDARFERPKC